MKRNKRCFNDSGLYQQNFWDGTLSVLEMKSFDGIKRKKEQYEAIADISWQ